MTLSISLASPKYSPFVSLLWRPRRNSTTIEIRPPPPNLAAAAREEVMGMFGLQESGVAASSVVGRMGTDAHLDDASVAALRDSRVNADKVDALKCPLRPFPAGPVPLP